jgi:hypothetical protein
LTSWGVKSEGVFDSVSTLASGNDFILGDLSGAPGETFAISVGGKFFCFAAGEPVKLCLIGG